MLTYYQKKRVIAMLKRIQNCIKYDEYTQDSPVAPLAMMQIDQLIRMHLDEPCAYHRTKSLPPRVWSDRKKKI